MGSLDKKTHMSEFQFKNPVLTDLVFEINNDFDNHDKTQVQIGLGIGVNIEKKGNNEATVKLSVEIGERSSKTPYFIRAVEKSDFRWRNEAENMVDILLSQNAPSLLLSYLRPIIHQITAASPYGIYDIPFINFAKDNL